MSQTSQSLKKLATSEEYKALAGAVEAKDYEAMAKAYLSLCGQIENEKKQILDKIKTLPRNADEDCVHFEAAFAMRSSSVLPHWHYLNQQLKEQGVMDGEVFGAGSRGDPLVRLPEGRVVVLSGAKLEKGAKVKFRVITPGQKLDFGQVIELNQAYFAFLLNRETREAVRGAFSAADECLRNGNVTPDETGLARISDALQKLEEVRELAAKLEGPEKDNVVNRIVGYRRRLLNDFIVKFATDYISREEEREITETCQGEELARALSAPAFFRYQAHQALKAELLAGNDVKGKSEVLKEMESKLDSMDAAIKLMEFQAGVDKTTPSARTYIERMDNLFARLDRKARQVAQTLAEGKTSTLEELNSTIKEAFSGPSLCAELGRTFRSADEFYTLRGALNELRSMMDGNKEAAAEAALKPYLSRKITAAFAGVGGRK
ncbi:MAG: hypothetical protein Q7R57_04290 [Dehalococcoidales bacterium]|nr:hypothetical protein [Dehalococcoidales bacterium]